MEKAKLWVYWNDSPVKITVTDKKDIVLHTYEDTDEGFCLREETYSLIDEWVYLEVYERSRDCDGILEREYKLRCHIDCLMSHFNSSDAVYYPDWVEVSSAVYDSQAEAMGY